MYTSVSHFQAGVKQIVLAVSYRAEQMEKELKHVEQEVGIILLLWPGLCF